MPGCNKSESHEHSSPPDLVVYGNIYTADQSESTVKAFAVKGGKFVFVGNKDEKASLRGDMLTEQGSLKCQNRKKYE